MQHLTIEEILAYVANRLTEEESFAVENHLAECQECVTTVHHYHIIRERFDELWDSWTARRHAEELLRAHVLEALYSAEIKPKLRERAIAWANRISEKTEAALNIVIDAPRKAARVFQEGLEVFFKTKAALHFSPIPEPTRVAGDREEAKIIIAVEVDGPPWVKVWVDPSLRRVTVQAEILEKPWPLVMLVPKGKGKAEVEDFRRPVDVDFLLAEFAEVTDGEYFLCLESPS